MDASELIIDTSETGIAAFVLNRPAELNAWTYPLAAIKRQLLDAGYLTLPEAYEQAADLMEPALVSADHREGVQAFRERRPPRFAPLPGGVGRKPLSRRYERRTAA